MTNAGPQRELILRFPMFGTSVTVIVEPGERRELAHWAALEVRRLMADMHVRLTRFEPSELTRLNADPRERVPASPLLARGVRASLRAAELSGGLADPTLADALERSGYARSLTGVEGADPALALAAAPARRPARPRVPARWREVRVEEGAVARPPGTRLDLGGSAKGLAADLALERLAGLPAVAVDVGGDVALGGTAARLREVQVRHPLRGGTLATFGLAGGAVATSSIAERLWRGPEGHGHHLIDPSRGTPAWTGVVQATALARDGVEAEALAKAALLAGPDGGRALLEPLGGLLVLDDGTPLAAGSLASPGTLAVAA